MALVIPDTFLKSSNLSESTFKIELACRMYQKNFFSLGLGAEFCSLPQMDFMKELGKRNVRWNYTTEDLHEDLKNLESLK